MLTAFYSFRLISLFFLSLFSIFFGYIASDLYVGLGSDFMVASVFQHPSNITLVEAEFSLPLFIKLLPAILTIVGAVSAVLLYHFYPLFLVQLTDNKLGRN